MGILQAANLRGFCASMNPRFDGRVRDFLESQILWKVSIHFNVVHRKVHWWNRKLKSLNSMPALPKEKTTKNYQSVDHVFNLGVTCMNMV